MGDRFHELAVKQSPVRPRREPDRPMITVMVTVTVTVTVTILTVGGTVTARGPPLKPARKDGRRKPTVLS